MDNKAEINKKNSKIFFLLVGAFLLIIAGIFLSSKDYQLMSQFLASSFFCFAFSSTPEVGTTDILKENIPKYGLTSKVFLGFAILFIALSIYLELM